MQVTIDFAKITDWGSFHSAFQECMGFPAFYGMNMDAWIDCMSCIDNPDAEMTTLTVPPGDSLDIIALNTGKCMASCPEVFQGFLKSIAFVNRRFIDSNSRTRLKLIAT